MRAAVAAALICAACGSEPRRVRMRVIAPLIDDPLAVVEDFTFVAEHPRFGRIEGSFNADAAEFELPGIEAAEGWVFELFGFAAGSPIAYGRTCPVDVPEDGELPEPVLYFSMLRAFSIVGAVDSARSSPAILPLPDGDALVLGGDPPAAAARYVRARAGFDPPTGEALEPVETAALAEGFLAAESTRIWLVELDGRLARVSTAGEPREGGRVVAVDDGRVLLVGGSREGTLVADTWWFDPDHGRFEAGPPLEPPREMHTASAVPPSVVVAGGRADGLPLDDVTALSAVQSPSKGKLARARWKHAAVVLGGKVLITGGLVADDAPISDAELWSALAGGEVLERMNVARAGHTATLIADGRFVLIAGGWGADGEPVGTAELYDVDSREFLPTADMKRPRAEHAALALCDGTVLFVGGMGEGTVSAEIYNPDPTLRDP